MGTTERVVTNGAGEAIEREVIDSPQDSVEVSINAKGEPSWSVKAYGKDPTEIGTRLRALREIAEYQAAQARANKGATPS